MFLSHVQNPPSRIREPLIDRGLGVTMIVKKKVLKVANNI